MKRLLTLSLAIVGIVSVVNAQSAMKDLFAGNAKLTFLGVDFTHAKFVGAAGFMDTDAIKNQHIKSWNSLLVLEPKKFSLQEPFKIKDPAKYETSIEDLTRINGAVDVAGNLTESQHTLSEADVKKIVGAYKLTPSEGVGVVYVAENLDKNKEEFTAWVTFIDLSARKVLHTERMVSKPGGFGFRNFWAGAIYKLNKSIESKYYKQWAKQFI
jgi:hypothetical protein